ncbi:MAG: nitronate monooxygenase [Ilumatobacteraceae bacterium]
MSVLDQIELPIVQAPMAGGPSTPALVAAVGGAGGLGFLGAGYVTPARLAADIAAVRVALAGPFGVNVFVADASGAPRPSVDAYAREIAEEAARVGVAAGVPRFDDDDADAKIDLLCADPVAVVSFTFGLPPEEVVRRLGAVGTEVWVTVTSPDEARAAIELRPDALVVQGVEAGGHRGISVDDDEASDLTLLAALQLIEPVTDCPLVAAGGLSTGGAIAAVLVAGAAAAQLGTAYLRCPEAGTSEVHRVATASPSRTVLTRAFSGRLARGIENRFHRDHASTAPRAYPEVHHLTSPVRAHGRASGDADLVNLWAGQTHQLAQARPAGELTRALADDARRALSDAARRLGAG